MSTTETKLVSQRDRVLTVRNLILANKDQIAMALPRFMNADRLVRTALTTISTTPELANCTARSLVGAVMQCAQLGLEPGILGMAYLIPFRNNRTNTIEVQFIPGYKGLLAIARRSGEISTIQAHTVHAKDAFKYQFGSDPFLKHTPSEDAERGAVTHFYAVSRLKDGGVQFEVMTKAEIDQHRDRYSRAAKQGPWVSQYDEMAKKTVLRRLCKLLPASVELHEAVALDERAELQIPQNLGTLVPGEEETPPAGNGGALDQLAERMEAEKGTA